MVALPSELSEIQNIALAKEYCNLLVEKYGVAIDYSIHKPTSEDNENYHAHIMMTTRSMENGELGKKTRVLDDKRTGSKEFEWIRHTWAETVNTKLDPAYHISDKPSSDNIKAIHHGWNKYKIEENEIRQDLKLEEIQLKIELDKLQKEKELIIGKKVSFDDYFNSLSEKRRKPLTAQETMEFNTKVLGIKFDNYIPAPTVQQEIKKEVQVENEHVVEDKRISEVEEITNRIKEAREENSRIEQVHEDAEKFIGQQQEVIENTRRRGEKLIEKQCRDIKERDTINEAIKKGTRHFQNRIAEFGRKIKDTIGKISRIPFFRRECDRLAEELRTRKEENAELETRISTAKSTINEAKKLATEKATQSILVKTW
jgi:hypothetical protein